MAGRTKYRFLYRHGNIYVWESVHPLRGDSRYEQITCAVEWFWAPRYPARYLAVKINKPSLLARNQLH